MNKYQVRKLLFVVAVGLLIYTPIEVVAYRSRNTQDPYILIARDVEGFDMGGVDVLGVQQSNDSRDTVLVITYIKDYPDWSIRRDRPNFNQHVLQAIARRDFNSVTLLIGWDFPPEDYRVQGAWICTELRRDSCDWETVPSIKMLQEFVKWPGIGKP